MGGNSDVCVSRALRRCVSCRVDRRSGFMGYDHGRKLCENRPVVTRKIDRISSTIASWKICHWSCAGENGCCELRP